MGPQIVQNLRYKLQKRIQRLNSVNEQMFIPSLHRFWHFFYRNPVFSGIMQLLLVDFPEIRSKVNKFLVSIKDGRISNNIERLEGETEEEAAAIGYEVLRCISKGVENNDILRIAKKYDDSISNVCQAIGIIRLVALEPFYEYVDEKLDEQHVMLALMLRYKQRCEWFSRDNLNNLYLNYPQKAEKMLALDLYAYLHDQGIEFIIEPSSITGKIDLIAAQSSEKPLLADAKIFDGEKRGKPYIITAFNQIYTYTRQYNEPFGSLIIFKTTEKDLNISTANVSGNIPSVSYNYKTIFFIVIDIFLYPESVSKRKPLNAIDIKEDELINKIENSN